MSKAMGKNGKEEKAISVPSRRLSPWRLMAAIVIVFGLAWGAVHAWNSHNDQKAFEEDDFEPWFAPYVDVTAVPSYAFEQAREGESKDRILSFVVSSSSDPCVPSWGTYYTMDEAASSLDLDRRIARLEQQGGRIAVSFGGALNSELALGCSDQDRLFEAYDSVISRYGIDTVDLDIENQSLSDVEVSKRRASVIASLQKKYRESGRNLAVWLTLPASPQGLSQAGTDAIADMLSSGVDLAGINLMVMDYGSSLGSGQSMLDASRQAMTEAHRQLGVLYGKVGISLDSLSLWRKIGATPMIGQNDFPDEAFSLEDAQGLDSFALSQGIGRMSMWSANRDAPCGENYVDLKVVSDSCSGVKNGTSDFAKALSQGFSGGLSRNSGMLTESDPEAGIQKDDDPKKSPYQIWKETGAYPKGVKVVWHGNVYEAKWWTKNDLPDNPVLQAWQTPWQLIGPVLPGEKPIEQPTLPKGTYPEWVGEKIYQGGDRVLFEGTPFQAKWWNQGESPAASAANPDSSPWIPLTQSQIVEVLGGSADKSAK